MYYSYFNLREPPFELTPDPKFLFLTARHREALSNLEYGLFAAKSITVLIGESGTGKTTLLNSALASERCRNVRCVYLNNPALTRQEFVNALAARFDLGTQAGESKGVLLDQLERVLRERRGRGEITALIVDEAQCLSVDLLEEVRLLANIETTSQKLLPLVLAGQAELGARLEDPRLKQFKQRIALRCEIGPFQLSETGAYIARRIEMAGGMPQRLFTKEAVVSIHEHAGGIARTISVICDNALMSAMALNRPTVDRAIVLEVCRDFVLPRHFDHRAIEQQPPTVTVPAAVQDKPDPVISPAPREPLRMDKGDQQSSAPNTLESARTSRRLSLFGSGLTSVASRRSRWRGWRGWLEPPADLP